MAIGSAKGSSAISKPMVRLQRGDGGAALTFELRAGATRLVDVYQHEPCKVLQPDEEPGEPAGAVLLTTSGGLAGGDRIAIKVTVAPGAAARVSTQAAEKVYGAAADDLPTAIAQDLSIGEGGLLEWLPQETILFERARLSRRTEVQLTGSGRLLACDLMVLGRIRRGERFGTGDWLEQWRISRDGRPLWRDSTRLVGEIDRLFEASGGFGGRAAMGSVLVVGADPELARNTARTLLDETGALGGATIVNGVMIARFLGEEAQDLRAAATRVIVGLRARLFGLEPRLPRGWYV